jgi:hypothetical protein
MTRIEKRMEIERRANQESKENNESFNAVTENTIIDQKCPGFYLDGTESAHPINNTVKKVRTWR